MISLTTLRSKQDPITERCARLLRDVDVNQVFNPSIDAGDDGITVAFRALDSSGAIRAYLLESSEGGPATLIDLSAHCAPVPVSDPKIVRLGGRRWVTFNSGWSETRNDLYIMQIDPEFGDPVRCHVDGRRSVEKNWAFFEYGGRLKALYSLFPAVILDAAMPSGPNDLTFDVMVGALDSQSTEFRPRRQLLSRQFSIGTQPIQNGEQLRLIAHEKLYVPRRRAYVGRAATVDLSGDLERNEPEVQLGRRRLVHSHRSMLGARTRSNPHLLSCTYFSGLAQYQGVIYLGYGVNDVDAGFSASTWPDLW